MRKTLFKELKLLEQQGTIQLGYAYIEILSEARLQGLAQHA